MEKPRKRVAVIMQRRAVDNQWQSEVWEPVGVLADYKGETIARYVEHHAIDAIVMGTRGMSALKSFLLGSVAAKVVGLAEVPVALVK